MSKTEPEDEHISVPSFSFQFPLPAATNNSAPKTAARPQQGPTTETITTNTAQSQELRTKAEKAGAIARERMTEFQGPHRHSTGPSTARAPVEKDLTRSYGGYTYRK
ncbi:hypothetical protein IAQ61_006217 [Plenodomus lingam]|uniref:uncharacterized protein n=1 Tax=Leptosphaeria maculans TaxID=5022 RepID=UPI00331799BE|nr:hypothetical protein IAQ61_006217 [Plenodomus lingam]